MELEDAEKEVCMLEQEARGALEENKRYCKHLSNKTKTKKYTYFYILNILSSWSKVCSIFNLRVRNELQNVPAIRGPEDSGMQSKSQVYIGIRI